MLIRYIGRKGVFTIRFNRVPYHFSKENNYTLDIEDKKVVNYIFGLVEREQFEAVELETPKVVKTKTDIPKTKKITKKHSSKKEKKNGKN